MKLLKIFFLLPFLFVTLNAQANRPEESNLQISKAKFYQEFLNFKSDMNGFTRVDAFVQVPYDQLQFVKISDNNFESNYTVTITVFDEDKEKIIVEKLWNETITAEDFDQTISSSNYNLSLKSFDLIPGKYFIRSEVEDKDSRKSSIKETEFNARDLSEYPSVSDIMLISKKTASEDGGNKIIPNLSRNIYSAKDGITIFYEIYSNPPTNFKIQYNVFKEDSDIFFSDQVNEKINDETSQIFYTIDSLNLEIGKYNIGLALKDSSNDEVITTISKSFYSRWAGIPEGITDLSSAIDQLVYIAEEDELDKIRDAENKKERIKKFLSFWKEKDPVPSTKENQIFNEYYRRVAYANENFSRYQDGWKSDRGMVYIILGPPNHIDRHPFAPDSKPYEIWEYYQLNRSFVFLDETGFGDYRLITPLHGDDWRFRR